MSRGESQLPGTAEAQQQLATFSQTTFTAIQHDFHELNHEIPESSPLEPFRHEYAKLFNILQKSMTNQSRYIEKCRVIESEIGANQVKIKSVIKLGEEDGNSITKLNEELCRRQSAQATSTEDLKSSMDENSAITSSIATYEEELNRCNSDEKAQKDFLTQLKARRTELKREFDELTSSIPQYEEKSHKLQESLDQKDKETESALGELKKVQEMVQAKKKEDQAERQRLFDLERDREVTKNRLLEAKEALSKRQQELDSRRESAKSISKSLADLKRRFESMKSEKQDAEEKQDHSEKGLEFLTQETSGVEKSIAEGRKKLRERQSVLDELLQQSEEAEKERASSLDRHSSLMEEFQDSKNEANALKIEINKTQDFIDKTLREGELLKKQIEACVREENNDTKQEATEYHKKRKTELILEMFNNQAHNIDCEVGVIKSHLLDYQRRTFLVDKEREKYSGELSETTTQYLHGMDVLKEIEKNVNEKSAEICEAKRRVQQQQTLYEQVRGEREVASKKVKDVQNEIKQLENDFNRMKIAIEQHKENIRRADRERVLDKHDLDNINLEERGLREKLAEVELETGTASKAVASHEGEISKLNKAIMDAEQQLSIEIQRIEAVKKERDQMSNQNVQRENELKELDQKLDVLKNQCKRGERDYDMQEVEITKVRAQLDADQNKLAEVSEIDDKLRRRREQIHKMQKELLDLQSERAAMESELKIPINIHRWTLLESGDPERFEKLKRYQELQAELMSRTKAAEELQDKIKGREEELGQLNAQARRKPGVEVQQSVVEYGENLKSEKGSLEQINIQLEIYREAAKKYQKDLSEVQNELIDKRSKWINQKKKDIKSRMELEAQQKVLEDLGLGVKAQ